MISKHLASSECPPQINAYLHSLPLKSFTPVSIAAPVTSITYVPSPELTIRTILSLPPPFTAKIMQPPSLFTRSRQLKAREAKRLMKLTLAATIFTIPTVVIVVGMFLPKSYAFRMWWDMPIWGNAPRSVIALWVLATFVQFGVGR